MNANNEVKLTKVTALGEESTLVVDADDIEDVFQDESSINNFTAVVLVNGDRFWVLESVDEVRRQLSHSDGSSSDDKG